MPLVILGLGNELLGDDGIGLLAAEALRPLEDDEIAIRTTAQSGLYLLEHLQGFDDAIVIDSVVGDRPGTVRELRESEAKPGPVPSAHYAGLPEALALARISGLPVPRRLRIFGVEIGESQSIGAAPSPEVTAALPRIVATVTEAARAWGYGPVAEQPEEVEGHA